MKIALFGGSFDPPHLGHNEIVKQSLKYLNIDKLIIMPTFISLFKTKITANEKLRLFWINKLWGNLKKVEICDFEIKQNRPVPSFESVIYIKSLLKPSKFYLIIGADHLENLHLWHNFEELKKNVDFIIASRNNINIPSEFQTLKINCNISSSEIRQGFKHEAISDIIKEEVKEYYAKFI